MHFAECYPDDVQLLFRCRLLFFQPGAQLGADLEYWKELTIDERQDVACLLEM